jgi:cyclohexadieny/prephenate dehydrogenase
MNAAPSDVPLFRRVAIYGVGLLGGSIGAALRARVPEVEVWGVGRNAGKLQAAVDRGQLHKWTLDPQEAAAACDLLVFCTPVDQIVPGVALISEACRPGTLITDVGSTKAILCDELYELAGERVEFVGSHPIAGSDKQGAEHGRADLFQDRVCVVTPRSNNTAEAVDRVGSFWQSLGMRVATMSPAEHDETLAVTSHLPHLAAAAVAQLLEPRLAAFAASGFRDTTRIALGDPALWTAIFLTNRGPVLESLSSLLDVLQHYRRAIDSGDERQLQRLLSEAQYHRQKLV